LAQISNIFVDTKELGNYEDTILQREDQVLIPKNSLGIGDKVNIVYNEENTERKEVTMLSIEHERVYKNLALEAEIEFSKKNEAYEQSFELIVRAISRWDKTYTTDEYYVFGLKGERFYFAKVAYHREEENSFPYKVLFNLNKDPAGITEFFVSLDEEKQKKLFLSDFNLNYETKYKLRCEIVDDVVSFKIKDTSKTESYETKFPWISIFDGISIRQNEETLSKRTSDLVTIVGVSEPNTTIDGQGLFGFTVPNSHVKVFRFEVTPLDENFDVDLFDDEKYSRNVATDFSNFYRTNVGLRLNSSDSSREFKNDFREYDDVEGDTIDISDRIKTEDVNKIQMNNVEVEKEVHYEDRFVDVISSMSEAHNGSVLKAFINNVDINSFGETEKFFPLEEFTDGVSFEYEIDEEVIEKVKYFPGGELAQVLLEVDSDIILDEFNKVGLQKNPRKFVTDEVLEEDYAGRKLFMETTFRGRKRFFELGPLGNGRFTFDIDEYFASANDSYESIWKYNLANFVDGFLSQYEIISYTEGLSGTIPTEFSFAETTPIIDFDYSQYSDSFGYVLATMDVDDIVTLSNKTRQQVAPDFSARDQELDSDVLGMIRSGVPIDHIRLILGVYQSITVDIFREILDRVVIKDKSFEVTLDQIVSLYGGNDFEEYKESRGIWMEDLDHNSHVTTGGLESRVFYVSEDERKVSIDQNENQIVFVDTPPANRKMVVRVFYDNLVTLTRSYNTLDEFYRVDEGIKELYDVTDTENGIKELLEYYDPGKYNITETNGVPFVIVPKDLNENDSRLFADVEVCTPFIEKTEGVRRKAKVPLIKVSDFLKNDFESSVYDDKYLSLSIATSASSVNSPITFESGIPGYDLSAVNNVGTPPIYEAEGDNAKIIQNGGFGKPMMSQLVTVTPNTNYIVQYVIESATAPVVFRASPNLGEGGVYESESGISDASVPWSGTINRVFNSGANSSLYVGLYVNEGAATGGDVGANFVVSYFNVLEESGGNTWDWNWNRETDFYDPDIEIFTGGDGSTAFAYDYPRTFPIPSGSEFDEYFDSNNEPIISNEFFQKLITGSVVAPEIIDQYLNVSNWYNVNSGKLGDYYKKVLEAIIQTKTLNRYYTNKRTINEDTQDPLSLGNWFDGFYSGERTTWALAVSGNDFGGAYEGNPWGVENSRKQMVDQIRNTMEDKFSQYEVYFVDYTQMQYYQRHNTTGFDANEWDTDLYPISGEGISGNDRLINNPYVDDRMSDYQMGVDVLDPNTGEVLFSADDYSFSTNNVFEYPEETLESYGNEFKTSFKVLDVVRQIQNGIDMYWGFNTSIMFSEESGLILPNGVRVSAEYQYSMDELYEPANIPRAIIQKSHLGKSNGTDLQKFPNPNILTYKNINNTLVHRVWLDNYTVSDFTVFDLGDDGGRIILSDLPKNFDRKKDVAIQYDVNNYYDLRVQNLFIDDFGDKRDLTWIDISRDKKGYLKKTNPYQGYITDNTKISGENVYRMSDFVIVDDSVQFKTASTANSTDLIRPIQYGQDIEDVISILTVRRNNNFEISVDVIFDDDMERDLMQTDIIFRGKFNNSEGRQFFNENYSITIGLENSSIALVARSINGLGVQESQILANVRDASSVIKRNKFYTIRFRVIGDVLSLYFNERNQGEKFYFSYNLKTGHKKDGVEAVAESLLNGLGVLYEEPKFYIDGDRVGLRSLSPKTNFSNFKLTALEENNFKLGNTFNTVSFDDIISGLKDQYSLTGDFKKLKRTSNGYEYIQIGTTLFAKQNGGTYVQHSRVVEDFEVIGEFVYVRERNIDVSKFEVINVYKDTLKLIDNIVVDGKQFIDEPILSYQIDSSRVIVNIEDINGQLFITTEKSCLFAKTWSSLEDCVWEDAVAPWDVYG
jgi:hypothetical protein